MPGGFHAAVVGAAAAVIALPMFVAVTYADSGTQSQEMERVAAQYLDRIDAVYEAPTGVAAKDAAAALREADAKKALSARDALLKSGLRVASASYSVADIQSLAGGDRPALSALITHTYELTSTTSSEIEPTWQESIPTTIEFETPTSGSNPVVAALVEQGLATEAQAEGSVPEDSIPATDPSVDDVDTVAAINAATGAYVGMNAIDDIRQNPPEREAPCAYPSEYACYDRQVAVRYVLDHACSTCHDPAWHYYHASNGDPEDCTNFISTALYIAGGWPEHNKPHQSVTAWWYKNYTPLSSHSRSWTLAHDFYLFLKASQWAHRATNLSTLAVGDLLQVDWGSPNGSIDHTAMVTAKDDRQFFLSYHSNDTVNKPWSVFRQSVPGSAYYGWLMQPVVDSAF